MIENTSEGHPEVRVASTPSISGFGLFTLCHYFGRRGRAMASSISRQIGCRVPIQLTVFYSRQEDADWITEGAAGGPTRIALSFIRVDPDDIMQRAEHFSRAQDLHKYSHTVFIDADLWFPPDFWASYTDALASEDPGYWSCRVMNVPYAAAEDAVDRWMEIRKERLDLFAKRRCWDQHAGRVGQFQCVPRGLQLYPPLHIYGVHTADLAFSKTAIERSDDRRRERRISRVGAYHLDHPYCWEGTAGAQF